MLFFLYIKKLNIFTGLISISLQQKVNYPGNLKVKKAPNEVIRYSARFEIHSNRDIEIGLMTKLSIGYHLYLLLYFVLGKTLGKYTSAGAGINMNIRQRCEEMAELVMPIQPPLDTYTSRYSNSFTLINIDLKKTIIRMTALILII